MQNELSDIVNYITDYFPVKRAFSHPCHIRRHRRAQYSKKGMPSILLHPQKTFSPLTQIVQDAFSQGKALVIGRPSPQTGTRIPGKER